MSGMLEIALHGRRGADFVLDVTGEIPMAGVTALLGPSASGKTSLLRAIAGLDRLSGTIRFNGETWQDGAAFVPAHRRRIGYVFQGAGLLPHLSVARNLAYARRRAPEGPFGFEDVVRRARLAPLLERMPARLSGGEAQRASIARALLGQPRLLLMDEPLSALDSAARAELLDHLEELLGSIAIPVLYVSHDIAEATRLARRAIHLREGRIDQIFGSR